MPAAQSQTLLTMSAFCGLLTLRRYHQLHPAVELTEAIRVAKRLSADDAHHDYDAALVLHGVIDESHSVYDAVALYRQAIASVIRHAQPWWTRFAPLGRERLRVALSVNEAQCFEAAGLFVDMPTREVLTWWDTLAQTARAAENDGRLQQGREAEQLTMSFERERLARLGIARSPRWIALDDNTAGYDVQSFDVGTVEPISKLIEVKSCAREAVEIFISCNEWETAVASAPHYFFHIWLLPEKVLIELTPQDIEPHIPANRGTGAWQSVRVTVTP